MPTALGALERAVLHAARDLTLGFDLTDDVFAVLAREFGNESSWKLLFSIEMYSGTVRLLTALRVDLEDEVSRPTPSSSRFEPRPSRRVRLSRRRGATR